MAVEIKELRHPGSGKVEGIVLKCTTSDRVFGHVLDADADDVEEFLSWFTKHEGDPRTRSDSVFREKFIAWIKERDDHKACARCGDKCPSQTEHTKSNDGKAWPLCSGCDEQLGWVAVGESEADRE